MHSSRAIVLFARTPAAEAAAKHLRVEAAAPLFHSVIAAWLRAAERVGVIGRPANEGAGGRTVLSPFTSLETPPPPRSLRA